MRQEVGGQRAAAWSSTARSWIALTFSCGFVDRRPATRPASLAQQGDAPRLLADRLQNTGGEARINSPFDWVTRRGRCSGRPARTGRCDGGIRLDTGGDCGNAIRLRRARRARIAAGIDREVPGIGEGERCQVIEDRMREHAAIEAETWCGAASRR
ncbi:hypothetical protein [Streptomyces sp. NPDC003247]|uniref:hypothetical protein n=1 Tax=Streptomyces sp. NPDC003247 TaxID=3364677 RepID=UPI0036A6AF63